MTELSLVWKKIFDEISIADDHIVGKINYQNLASILEDLYVENAELKARVEALEDANKKWYHPESGLVAALRQLVFELQYYQCCGDEGVEDMVLDARDILDVCDELENL